MTGTSDIDVLLEELDAFGRQEGGMWNVGPDGGALLAWLVRLLDARRVLEIGSSNGYSTIWIARALDATGGEMVSLEVDPVKAEMARANLTRAGLNDLVKVVEGPALVSLQVLGGPFDLVFIDASKEQYSDYLTAVMPLVRAGSVIIADNVVSHADATAAYRDMADADPRLDNLLLPVGDGMYLSRVLDDQ